MAKVKIMTLERSQPAEAAGDGVESRTFLSGKDDPLHLVRHALAPSALLPLRGDPTDTCAYVLEGSVAAHGLVLDRGASMIVEYGAEAEVVAGTEGAVILAFNQAQRAGNARPGGHLHLLPREAVPCTHDLGTQNEMGGGIHADAACPTCSVWLHENDFHCASGTTIPPHSHSEDEIIFVTAGEIGLGNRRYGPGTALAVAADTVYGFQAGAGLSFINFRAAPPTVTTPNGMHDEAQMWLSSLGKPPYTYVATTQ